MNFNSRLNYKFNYGQRVVLRVIDDKWAETLVQNKNQELVTVYLPVKYNNVPVYVNEDKYLLYESFKMIKFRDSAKKLNETTHSLQYISNLVHKLSAELAINKENNEALKRNLQMKTAELEKSTQLIQELQRDLPTSDSENSYKSNSSYVKCKIPKRVKDLCWDRYIGEDNMTGNCYCCKTAKISYKSFQCGHVMAECKGGKTNIENLRPICSACNSSMGTMNMYEFMEKYM